MLPARDFPEAPIANIVHSQYQNLRFNGQQKTDLIVARALLKQRHSGCSKTEMQHVLAPAGRRRRPV